MKRVVAFALIIVMMFSLIACSTENAAGTTDGGQETQADKKAEDTSTDTSSEKASKDNTGQKWKVGFALQTLEVAVWKRMVEGMQTKADELGNVEFKCMVANGDVATQISNIENMIAQGFNAIIVHVFDTEAFADVVQQALDAGIVVCAYDDTILDTNTGKPLEYQFSFVCDNYDIGYRVGTMAAEWTKANFEGDDTIQFGLLWHKEYQLQWDRVDGIKEAFAKLDPRQITNFHLHQIMIVKLKETVPEIQLPQ